MLYRRVSITHVNINYIFTLKDNYSKYKYKINFIKLKLVIYNISIKYVLRGICNKKRFVQKQINYKFNQIP